MTSEISKLKMLLNHYNDQLFETRSPEVVASILVKRGIVMRRLRQLAKSELADSSTLGKVSLEYAQRLSASGLIFFT